MKIRICRIDKSLPLPKYETSGSVGFDLLAREETIIEADSLGLIPGNVIVKIPPGHVLLIISRSSSPRKKGLSVPHGLGVIDQDYSGPEDEVMIQVYNFTDQKVTVEKGERIAQGLIVPVTIAQWEEFDEAEHEGDSRGGFGSTDS